MTFLTVYVKFSLPLSLRKLNKVVKKKDQLNLTVSVLSHFISCVVCLKMSLQLADVILL